MSQLLSPKKNQDISPKDIKLVKLFQIFNYDLSLKNNNLLQSSQSVEFNSLIEKIFLFGIKYYNSYENLNNLIKEVEKFNIVDNDSMKKNIEQIRVLKDYSLFYSFYEESFKMKGIYHKHKNEFNDLKFDEENKKYLDETFEKIDFMYNSIIACDDYSIQPNSSIIKNLIELIDYTDIGIHEIIQYSRIQNINSQIKIIELLIINNLLLYLVNESNIVFIINLISKKMRHIHSKSNSIFDNTYAVDYYIIEKLKQQFHSFLSIISYKILDNYSITGKISLTESLIWKIKRRNFPILLEIMKIFEEIKTEKEENKDSYLFNFENIDNCNVKYFHEKKNTKCQFEVFKILVYQILNIIKDILQYEKENEKEDKLSLQRNISSISEVDYNIILEKILEYFIAINPECVYYDDIILFFYKIFIHSNILFNYIWRLQPKVIKKIYNISFDNDKYKYNQKRKNNTRLIMLKLLCLVIENITQNNLEDLNEIINTEQIIPNPLIYLYEKLYKEISNDNQNLDIMIHKYYINLLFICINKILEIKGNENFIKVIDKNILNILLFDENNINTSENQLIIKSENEHRINNHALFNSPIKKANKKGKIICFIEDGSRRNIVDNFDISPVNFDSNNEQNKYSKALVITEDFEQLDFYNISNTEILPISYLEIINNENKHKKAFIEKNSNLLFNVIKEELIKDILNEKGIYLIFKLLAKLIIYINKEDLLYIFEYIWKFYIKSKEEQNDYPFMSLEYIERKVNQFFTFNNLRNIYMKKEDNENSLYSLFNYRIKDNTLEISRNLEYINKIKKIKLINLFNKGILSQSIELSNLSFYISDNSEVYKIINEDSILFCKSILTNNDLSDISNLLNNNINKIKVIIIKEISDIIDKEDLNNFINNLPIPIYQIEKNEYHKIVDFFLRGNGMKYIYFYKHNQYNSKDDANIFNVFKIKFNDDSVNEEIDPMEKIIKTLPKFKLNKINDNQNYKIRMCKNYKKDGICKYNDRCDFAHSNEEINEIKKIREYLNNKKEKDNQLNKNDKNRNNLFREIKNETRNIFNILNFKLSERLIYDILDHDCIELSELEKNIIGDIENVFYIYDSLCLEYYFNFENQSSNDSLRERLIKYFEKLINDEIKKSSKNKYILYLFEQVEKINYIQNDRYSMNIFDLNISNLYNEKKLLEKIFTYPDIFYDRILFLIDLITKKDKNEYFIKYYFDLISKIADNLVNHILNLSYNVNENKENFEYILLSKVTNILYKYYCNKTSNNNVNEIIENTEIIDIPSKLDEAIKKLMEINIDDYFPKDNNLSEEGIIRNNARVIMPKQIAYIIEFIFKYFDICLILFYRENQAKFFNYIFDKKNKIFKYYCNYKILTMKKNNKDNDYKETVSFIYYLKEIMASDPDRNIKVYNSNFEMVNSHINEFKFEYDSGIYDVVLKNINNNIYSYNKLVVLCLNDKTKKYYFQDIIDLNSLALSDVEYKFTVNSNIFLVPLKNINTCLYSFEHSNNKSFKENNNQCKNLIKHEEIPKYTWNIGYNGNKYFLISEENDNAYSFIEQKNNSDSIKEIFDLEKRIETIKNTGGKIIDIFDGTSSSFSRAEKGDIFLVDENRTRYKWLTEKEMANISCPISITSVKIINISANYNECYAIGNNGLLYENKGHNFKKIPLPKDTKKFLQCACGNGYVICLVQNNEGKGNIYAKGINDNYQCGPNNLYYSNSFILTKCQIKEDLDFKYICTYNGFSAAITSCGKLYVWGLHKLLIKRPLLINNNEKGSSILIDKISLNYDHMYLIGRILENGNYITKLFSLELNKNYDYSNDSFILKPIDIINKDDNNSRNIPIKILIGKNRVYCLCINENKLIEEINKNNSEEDKTNVNNITKISISYNYNKSNKIVHKKDNLLKIYYSNEINIFIDLFNSLSDKNIQRLINTFDEIKKEGIKVSDIDYNELIAYLKNKDNLKDLLSFFLNPKQNEGKALFDYLKIRISLIEENIMNYININNKLKSEGFIQIIIEQNVHYLNDDMRIQYFYSLLLNMADIDYYPLHYHEMKIINIDRFKATNFKDKFNDDKIPDIHLKETIFGQLFQVYKDTDGKGFLKEKGERLFTVKLGEERAIDQGGPYREIISDMCDDLQSDYIELFIKTPNNKSDNGDLRDKYIINPNCNNINYNKAFEFIGKMMVLSISSGETFNLNLHPIFWKSLLENQITFEEYETIDLNFYNIIKQLEEGLSKKDKTKINSLDLNFVIKNSNGKDIELINNGQEIKVTLENVNNYINLAKSMRMDEMTNQIKYIKNGLYSGISKNILKILNWKQLEEMVCGKAEFDMEDFKKKTICNNEEEVIQWFWEWLETCKEEDKFKYLRFVSGRSRLPKSNYDHSINVIIYKNKADLPVAHTCSIALDLPKYDSKDILFEKMNYVIENVTNITDS